MTKETILKKVQKLIGSDTFNSIQGRSDIIDENTSLIDDLAFDSIQILELIVAIEKEFMFSCNPNELNIELFDNVSLLIEYIEKNVSKN